MPRLRTVIGWPLRRTDKSGCWPYQLTPRHGAPNAAQLKASLPKLATSSMPSKLRRAWSGASSSCDACCLSSTGMPFTIRSLACRMSGSFSACARMQAARHNVQTAWRSSPMLACTCRRYSAAAKCRSRIVRGRPRWIHHCAATHDMPEALRSLRFTHSTSCLVAAGTHPAGHSRSGSMSSHCRGRSWRAYMSARSMTYMVSGLSSLGTAAVGASPPTGFHWFHHWPLSQRRIHRRRSESLPM